MILVVEIRMIQPPQSTQGDEGLLPPVDEIPPSVNVELRLGGVSRGPRPRPRPSDGLLLGIAVEGEASGEGEDDADGILLGRAEASHLLSAGGKQRRGGNERVERKPRLFLLSISISISLSLLPLPIIVPRLGPTGLIHVDRISPPPLIDHGLPKSLEERRPIGVLDRLHDGPLLPQRLDGLPFRRRHFGPHGPVLRIRFQQ
mmetsp:Transcript_40623/g.122265  ORF Transcript_40623/g.122265 Transcript_40623/m.122265 type:complete len:202 (-) Transcript_40623:232-837(-)